MAHKPECPANNAGGTCNCGEVVAPPKTRKCWECDAEIGVSEKKCPKCQADLEAADQEDGVVDKALKRLSKKRKAESAAKKSSSTLSTEPARRKSIFSSLNRMKE